MTETRVTFPCGDLTLEGVTSVPEGEGPFPAVAVCHPHPLQGGMMDNNVVFAVCRSLMRASIASLRFNFRGVGRSEGRHDEGAGEQDDRCFAGGGLIPSPLSSLVCVSSHLLEAGQRLWQGQACHP